jgi:TPR repeat protein
MGLTLMLAALAVTLLVALLVALKKKRQTVSADAPAPAPTPPPQEEAAPPAPEDEEPEPARDSCPVCTKALPTSSASCALEVCCGKVVRRECSSGRNEAKACKLCGAPAAKDLDEYLERLDARVAEGNAQAQTLKASRVSDDDPAEAARLFRLAADQGLPAARSHLGRCYLEGRGVGQDAREAVNLWQLAADAGDATAQSRAAQESEIPNFKGSDLGQFPLVSADFWTSDHLSERPRSVDVFSVTRARGTLTLKRR